MTGAGSGDRLARGAVKAAFQTTDGSVKKKKWAEAFDDFDPEKFKNEPNKARVRYNSDVEETGDASADLGGVERK